MIVIWSPGVVCFSTNAIGLILRGGQVSGAKRAEDQDTCTAGGGGSGRRGLTESCQGDRGEREGYGSQLHGLKDGFRGTRDYNRPGLHPVRIAGLVIDGDFIGAIEDHRVEGDALRFQAQAELLLERINHVWAAGWVGIRRRWPSRVLHVPIVLAGEPGVVRDLRPEPQRPGPVNS